ncbi:hypothetical protein MPSEU_001067500 [Mayamaea pseudoterrestris]|nr:hypothetical protein MPSEU_001067500 [Mayamaea pseudoterrestris]
MASSFLLQPLKRSLCLTYNLLTRNQSLSSSRLSHLRARPAHLSILSIPFNHAEIADQDQTVIETGSSNDTKRVYSYGNSLLEMDAFQIRSKKSARELEGLIVQLEQVPILSAADVGPLLIPLSRMTSGLPNDQASPYKAALLTERILFACLKQLPSSIDARNEDSPYPDATLYNRALIAWGNTKTLQGAERAEIILQLMISEYKNDPKRSAAPDRRCYKSTLRAWAVARSSNASGAKHTVSHGTERAYQLLEEMERFSGVSTLLQREEGQHVASHSYQIDPPDRMVYNSVMASYAKAHTGDDTHALNRIKSIVARMDQLYLLTSNPEYKLDGHSYHSILRAYSRYVAYVPTLSTDQVLNEIVSVINRLHEEGRIDELAILVDRAWVYGVIVEALLKTHPRDVHVAKAHEYILGLAGRSMSPPESLQLPLPLESDVWPRHAVLIKMVRSWQRLEVLDEKKMVDELIDIAIEAPHHRSYDLNETMEEWIESKFNFAPKVVELILAHAMERRYRSKAKPTGQSFLIAIKAWLRCTSDEAPNRAELILQTMVDIYLESSDRYYKPREQHLRLLFTAWLGRCRTGRKYESRRGLKYPAEHIEALLQIHLGTDWFDKSAAGLYAMALRAWAIQRVKEGSNVNPIERLGVLLDKYYAMQRDELLPAYPCNWVLEGCGRMFNLVEQRQEAYTLAVKTFRRSKRNARTFVLMAQAVKRQVRDLDEGHRELVEGLFRECCGAGMLSQDMIWEVVEIASADSLQALFGVSHQYASGVVQVRDGKLGCIGAGLRWKGALPNALRCENLPLSWRCNATVGVKVK